jgi:nitrogen fixation/metabolism regulation signal transduction histidine kinase
MSLRARLVAALLVLALLPTVVFTIFTLIELDRATQHWFRPGVDRALESAQQVSRTALTRIEAGELARADAWARTLGTGPLAAAERAAVRAGLRDEGLDFLQLYERGGSRWRRTEQVLPQGVIEARGADLSAELTAALDGDRLVHSPSGALAAVARLDSSHALALGVWVPTDFFTDVERVIEGRGAYSRLGVMVDVQRPLTWLLVAGLVLLLAALAWFLAQALARPIARPLSELSAALDRVAAGDLGVRVRPAGARELRALGVAFNGMTVRLEQARAAMASAEREAAWREVARKLAHEFRNILTPLQLSLQMLEAADSGPAADAPGAARERHGNLEAALDEVAQLARLADQFSQYARLPEPRLERLDLAGIARSAATRPMCEGVTVSAPESGPVPVLGDAVLLARAAHNLVLNACEASPAGATVEVTARHEHGRAVLEVTDRGAGLPAGMAERVFEPYVSTKRRGSGLGLSLVRDIARQHGGSVTLEDREGGGARARLVLPLAPEGEAAAGERTGDGRSA